MSLFDEFAHTYKDGHAKAVKGTGYPPSFFHEYKIRELRGRLGELGLADRELALLDVGCGVGETDRYIKSYLPKIGVWGIDVSEQSIEVARNSNQDLPVVTYAHYDGQTIPFDRKFDVIFIANVFHHVRRDQHLALLRECRGRLEDGGVLFMFELNPFNPGTLWIAYRNDYKFDKDANLLLPNYARRILGESGFAVADLRYRIFFPGPLGFLLPLEKHLSRVPLGAHYYLMARK